MTPRTVGLQGGLITIPTTWTHPFPETVANLFGLRVSRVDRGQLLACFEKALDWEGPLHFGYVNVAVSNQAAEDPNTFEVLDSADLLYVDGAGVRVGFRLLGIDCPPRNTGADFYREVLAMCARRGKKAAFLGGSPEAAQTLAEALARDLPGLQILWAVDGYRGLEDEAHLQTRLEQDPPDLLLVGLGVPKQEEWIQKSRRSGKKTLYWSVGALFEYDSGNLARCPAWMGKAGLEWLYRLYCEPQRLWKRYLIGNPRFLQRCLCSRWRGRGETS